MNWGMGVYVGPGKVTQDSSLGGVEPLIPASKSWDGQCLTAKELFWLAGMGLDLRFALGYYQGFTRPPSSFLFVPPSPVFLS